MTVCRGCTTVFAPKREEQQYHNRMCFLKSSVKLSLCPECGKVFKKIFSKQICCSRKCSYPYTAKRRVKGKDIACAYCGKITYMMPSRIKKINFCSVAHRAAFAKSDKNIDFGKGWKHTPEEIEKIRQASLNRNYNDVLTNESRQKMAYAAKNKKWTKEAREKMREANLGKRLSQNQRQKISRGGKYGEDNYMWKGEAAGYAAAHIWAARHIGKTKKCADCRKTPKEARIELSNCDHKYRRVIADWAWRCTSCHRKYDYSHGLINPFGKAINFYSNIAKKHEKTISVDGIVIEPVRFLGAAL